MKHSIRTNLYSSLLTLSLALGILFTFSVQAVRHGRTASGSRVLILDSDSDCDDDAPSNPTLQELREQISAIDASQDEAQQATPLQSQTTPEEE